jgi:hypothetical protein
MNVVHFKRSGRMQSRIASSWERGKKLADRLAGAKGNTNVHLIRNLPDRLGQPETTIILNTPTGWSLVKWVWENKGPNNSDYRWCLHQYTP